VLNRYNLVGDGSCDTAFQGDPLLGQLSDNGGQTLTHSLLPDSPAIDAIPPENCFFSYDQLWNVRPVTLDSPETPCDIGAFELQGYQPLLPVEAYANQIFYEPFDGNTGNWEQPYGILRHTNREYYSAPGAGLLITDDFTGSIDYRGSFGTCINLGDALEDWPLTDGEKMMTIEAYIKTGEQIGKATLNGIFLNDPFCGTGQVGFFEAVTISGNMDWSRLLSTIPIPPGANSLHLFFSASSLSQTASLYVDDVRVYAPNSGSSDE
jgi:hypothetical protein